MDGSIVFKLVIGVMIFGMVLAAFVVVNSGRQFSQGINNQSETWDIQHAEAQRGGFRIERVRYSSMYPEEEEFLCSSEVSEVVLVTDINFMLRQLPQSCEVYVNNHLQEEIDLIEFGCIECPQGEELVSSVVSQPVSAVESHTIEVCCDGFCSDRDMPPACP